MGKNLKAVGKLRASELRHPSTRHCICSVTKLHHPLTRHCIRQRSTASIEWPRAPLIDQALHPPMEHCISSLTELRHPLTRHCIRQRSTASVQWPSAPSIDQALHPSTKHCNWSVTNCSIDRPGTLSWAERWAFGTFPVAYRISFSIRPLTYVKSPKKYLNKCTAWQTK